MKRITLLFALCVAACSSESGPPLSVSNVELTKPMPGRSMSAGYLILRNDSDEPTRVTSVSSPQFGSVEIHETQIDDGVSRMRELPEVLVAPGAEVRFERGGKHLMLMRPATNVSEIRLNFYSDDTLLVSVTVGDD